MNVRQGVAGKRQRSAIFSWINTGMKLEGTQQRTNLHQQWTLLQSSSFHKSLFVYCLSSGFDRLTKQHASAVLFSQRLGRLIFSSAHECSAIDMVKNKQRDKSWSLTSTSAPKANQVICPLHHSQVHLSSADEQRQLHTQYTETVSKILNAKVISRSSHLSSG